MFGHLINETPDEKRARRDRRLKGRPLPTPEQLRDEQVAREIGRPHHCDLGCYPGFPETSATPVAPVQQEEGMTRYTVTATLRLDFDTDEHPWITSEDDAERDMVEFLMSGDAGPDQFDISVESGDGAQALVESELGGTLIETEEL